MVFNQDTLAKRRKNRNELKNTKYLRMLQKIKYVHIVEFEVLDTGVKSLSRAFKMKRCVCRTLMASTHVNHNIYITEVKTGKCLHSLVGHRRTPWCVTFHPTIPGLVASGCLDGEVRIWDLHVSTPPLILCSSRAGC